MKNLLVSLASVRPRLLKTQSLTCLSKKATSDRESCRKSRGDKNLQKMRGRGAQGMESVTPEDGEASLSTAACFVMHNISNCKSLKQQKAIASGLEA